MEVLVIRGLPGSSALAVARSILHKPTDYIIDLTEFWETSQGNLFATQTLPDQAEEAVQNAMRSPQISRLAICGSAHKGWIESVIEKSDIEPDTVHWLIAEGAERPTESSKPLYDKLEQSFEIDLHV